MQLMHESATIMSREIKYTPLICVLPYQGSGRPMSCCFSRNMHASPMQFSTYVMNVSVVSSLPLPRITHPSLHLGLTHHQSNATAKSSTSLPCPALPCLSYQNSLTMEQLARTCSCQMADATPCAACTTHGLHGLLKAPPDTRLPLMAHQPSCPSVLSHPPS